MPAKNRINLLPQEEFDSSTFGRVLKWLLSTFRVIVVFTEIIVIAGFLSRFWLDARNTDLNEQIVIKSAFIEADSEFEKEFKNTQKRLRIFSSLSEKSDTTNLVSTIGNLLPSDVRLASIAIAKDGINISGKSASEISIYQFVTNLNANQDFKEVTLASVVSNPEDLGSLNFTVNLKRKG